MNDNSHILYRINARDEIVSVNEQWSRFAVENGAPDIAADKIIGRNLWSFISGDTVEDFYRRILRQARGGQSIRFNLRCDSPERRRLLELSIRPEKNGDVQFQSRTVWTRKKEPRIVLNKKIAGGDKLLIVCSWCGKINVAGKIWQKADEAVLSLGLFEIEKQPQLSHGMCADCHQNATSGYKSRFGGA